MEDGNGMTQAAIEGYQALLAVLDLDALFELSHTVHEDLHGMVIDAIAAHMVG